MCKNGTVTLLPCAQDFILVELHLEFLTHLEIDLSEPGASYSHISVWLWTASLTITQDLGVTIVFTCFNSPTWRWQIDVPPVATLQSVYDTLVDKLYTPQRCECKA